MVLIARAASPQALLSFRYTVGIFLSGHSRQRLGGIWVCVLRPEQVRPPRRCLLASQLRIGVSPAAKAMLVS